MAPVEATVKNTKAIVASYVGVLVFAGIIFLGAWKLRYWQGLLYLALALAGTALNHALVPHGSDLTARRAEEASAGQDWDKKLLGASLLVNIVAFLVAGLDSGRFGWSGSVPLGVTIAGAMLMVAGQVIFALAKRQNEFFASTVQIQTARGHRVCDSGLYRVVRHPGYLGLLMSSLAFPLVLNSYWAFIPVLVGAFLLVTRTIFEDRFLQAELPGYSSYTTRTKRRLIPGVF